MIAAIDAPRSAMTLAEALYHARAVLVELDTTFYVCGDPFAKLHDVRASIDRALELLRPAPVSTCPECIVQTSDGPRATILVPLSPTLLSCPWCGYELAVDPPAREKTLAEYVDWANAVLAPAAPITIETGRIET